MDKKSYRFVFLLCLFLPSICFAERQSILTPSISASEQYTDNLFFSEDNTESEWITMISPGIRYKLLGKTSEVNLSYAPTFVYYDKHTDFNTIRHNASIAGRIQTAKYTELTLSNTFVRTEEQLNREDSDDETIRESREPYYNNTVSSGISHQFGAADTISFKYTDTLRDHNDPDEEDSKSHAADLNLTYWFMPHFGIDTGVDYTRGEFDGTSDDFDQWNGHVKLIRKFSAHLNAFIKYAHTDMNYRESTSDYQVYDGSIGMGYTIEEDASISVSTGYLVRDRTGEDDEERITANIDLDKAWNFKRSSIGFKATSGYKESYFGAENLGFDWYWLLSTSARHYFSKHLSGNISGSYRRDKYEDTEDNRKDYTTVGTAGLSYQPRPWITTALTYTYRDRNSNIYTNDYEENSVILTIILTPTKPIRF